jgi:lipopolysaccharide transport system permease protein
VQAVPVHWQGWFALNPIVHILEAYRTVLIHGQYPDMLPLFWVTATTLAVAVASYQVFIRSSHRFIEEIGN